MIPVFLGPLTQRTSRSYLYTAIRLKNLTAPEVALARVARGVAALATQWECTVTFTIEPDGTACETGHFVGVEVENGSIWAEMTPWPERFCGILPEELHEELGNAGWVLTRDGADPDPLEHVYQVLDLVTEDQHVMIQFPVRRLVATTDTDDLDAWAKEVVRAINSVLAPQSTRWFLMSGAVALSGGALSDHPGNYPGEFYGEWSVDLGQLLEDDEWERAVWPAYSEAAASACRHGLHQFHEPPCTHHPDTGEVDKHD